MIMLQQMQPTGLWFVYLDNKAIACMRAKFSALMFAYGVQLCLTSDDEVKWITE